MAGYRERSNALQAVEARLETPRVAGYRSGMSATGLIGRRLARVYDVATEVPRDMGVLLSTLDGKADKSR